MAKYSFDTTTVGEIIDTPELRKYIEENAPDVLEHPLLEVGRSFIFADALPYISDMITDEQLDGFKEYMESLG